LHRFRIFRLDRGTLILLEEKAADAREKLAATQGKKETDRAYLKSLDSEIAAETEQLRAQLQSQITELRARVAESDSLSAERKALVDRQSDMVSRDENLLGAPVNSGQEIGYLRNADRDNAVGQ